MPKNKKLFLSNAFLLFLLSVLFSVPVRASTTAWTQKYGGEGREVFTSIVEASDGGYIIAGYTDSFGAGNDDFWLLKTDSLGNIEWNQTYGEASRDEAHSLVQTFDGGYALAGNKGGDFWLVKTDAQGNREWSRTYGGKILDRAHSLVQTSDGGYALAGFTHSYSVDYEDAWVVKTDAQGNVPEHHVYITASGKVEGTDKIQRNGDIYTFTDDIFVYYFFVEKDHIVVDGNGFTLYGSGAQGGGTGFDLTTRENVTIRNTNIQNLTIGIHLQTCIWNTILGNNISNNNIGIHTQTSAHNFMFENNITNNIVGVSFRSMSATFSSWASNNFVNNNQQISITPHTGDNMIVNALNKGALGNYWSDYNGTDLNGDGIGDTPHGIDENNQDNYPLVKHYIIPEFPSWSTLLLTLIAFTATVIICKHKLHVKPRLTKSPQK